MNSRFKIRHLPTYSHSHMLALVTAAPPCYKRSVHTGEKSTTSADGGACGIFHDDETSIPLDVPLCRPLVRHPVEDNVLNQQMTTAPKIPTSEVLDIELGHLSVRARNVLHSLDADNLDELLRLSHDELMRTRNCGKKTASEIEAFQSELRETYKTETQNIPERPIWADDAPKEVFEAVKATLSVRGINAIEAIKITNLKDFMLLNEKRLLKCRNCGRKTANEICRLQSSITDFANELAGRPSGFCAQDLISATCLTGNVGPKDNELDGGEYFVDIENPARWLCEWVQSLARSERQARAFMLHKGMMGHKPITLELVGDQIGGVTRERIRQMEKELEKRASASHQQQRLQPLMQTLVAFVLQRGGLVGQDELIEHVLCKGDNGARLRFASELLTFFATLPVWVNAGLHLQENGIVSHKDSRAYIARLSDILDSAATAAADEHLGDGLWSIPRARLKAALLDICFPEQEARSKAIISDAVLDAALRLCRRSVRTHNDRIYSTALWELRCGNVVHLVETVLRQIGGPAHFNDVAKEVSKWRPDFAERNTHAALDRCNNAWLWDLGTFVHKDNVVVPLSIIHDVEVWLLDALKRDVPFVCINGAYMHFKRRCEKAGLPSEVALYTCLRWLGHPKLVYPRLPCVFLKKGFTERLPMPLALEHFVRNAGDCVSQQELKDYALKRVYFKEFQYSQFSYSIANTIRTANWGYLHLDNYEIDHNALKSIIQHTHEVLAKEGHCSIEKIYSDKRVTCRSVGIDSPIMLYSIYQRCAEDSFALNGYPLVVKSTAGAVGKRQSIRDKVLTYVREADAPCTYEHLEEHFVHQLGYNEQQIYLVACAPDVCTYHYGCVVHLRALDWNTDKQNVLEDVACRHYTDAVRSGRFFARISRLLESSDLPALPAKFQWSTLLIADLLTKGRRFIVVGNGREAYFPRENTGNYQNLEDLVAALLNDQWGGAANLVKFEEALVKAGIVKRQLCRSMLSPGNKVEIRGGEILLKELLVDA